MKLEDKLKTLPASPGVYFHKSSTGEVIYVGKAAVLKNRVRQYFQSSRGRDNKTMALVAEIADTDWVETESEVDALFLESEMVKRYMPRYNVLLRDDKSQMYVRINIKDEWPIVSFTRNPVDDGAEYYGPFYNGFALKKALRYLRRVFPYLIHERRPGQSKLDEDLGLSPHQNDGSEIYKANLRKLISYIKGNRKSLMHELEHEMKASARVQDFEQATILRNKLQAMRELQQRVMFGDREFLDISKDKALTDLADILGLQNAPARIEGFDVSHISGQAVVASMVVFSNGVASRADYRKFKISNQTNDDCRSIYDAVYRRFSEKNIKSWGMPGLVIIDGGKGQLASAIGAIKSRSVVVPVISIAKKQDELIVHRNDSSVNISKMENSHLEMIESDNDFLIIRLHHGQKSHGHAKNVLYENQMPSEFDDLLRLIQRIRDEAHRFAISYHSTIRSTRQTESRLERIPGVGPKTRAKLIKRFGSYKQIQEATDDELREFVNPKIITEIRKLSDD